MQDQLTISRFAFLTGLPPKTLRYYDEIGLFRPERVDDLNGYRYYSAAQIGPAGRIKMWREIGLPLEAIRELLIHPECTQEVLKQHAQRLKEEIETREQSLRRLQHILEEDHTMQFRIEQLPALQTLTIRTHLKVPEFEVIPEAFRELMAYVAQQGYEASYPNFFACYNECVDGKNLVEMSAPVKGEVQDSGRMQVRTFDSRPAFVGRYVGPYEKLGEAYPKVAEEATRRGLKLSGSTAEFYVKSVPDTPDPQEYETDVAFFLED